MNDDALKPLLTLEDLQRGWKEIDVVLKSGDAQTVRVTGVSHADTAALYLEHKNPLDPEIERKLVRKSLPADLPPEFLDWLDWESRAFVVRLVREFVFGFGPEQKRSAEIRKLLEKYDEARRAAPVPVPAPATAAEPESKGS